MALDCGELHLKMGGWDIEKRWKKGEEKSVWIMWWWLRTKRQIDPLNKREIEILA